jgi:hypothetical protein
MLIRDRLAIAIAIEGSQPALALQIGSALLNPAAQ